VDLTTDFSDAKMWLVLVIPSHRSSTWGAKLLVSLAVNVEGDTCPVVPCPSWTVFHARSANWGNSLYFQ